jgi:hypothetical protein
MYMTLGDGYCIIIAVCEAEKERAGRINKCEGKVKRRRERTDRREETQKPLHENLLTTVFFFYSTAVVAVVKRNTCIEA